MKKNIMWNTVGSIFYCFCQWLITILVVRLSSYEEAGYLSLAMTTSSSFSAISLFSMRNYQVSDVEGEFTTNTYVSSRIITCIFAFIACTSVGFASNSLKQALCINAFMIVRVAEGIVDVLHGINQKYERYDYIGKSFILRGVATIVIFSAILIISSNLVITLYVMAFGNIAIALFYDHRMTIKLEHFFYQLSDKKIYKLLFICFPIVIFTFLLSLENLIPKSVLQQKYGAEELGIYSSIASPTLIVQVFASVVFNPFLPKFSLLYNKGDISKVKKYLHLIYLMLFSMCIVVCIGAKIFGKIGLSLLFGSSILEYYYLFMPIVICTMLTAIICVLSAVIIAIRRIKLLVIGMIGDFLICFLFTPYFIETYEKNGVSFIQIFVLVIYIVFMIGVCELSIRGRKR